MVHQERLRQAADDRLARRLGGNARPFGVRLLLRLGAFLIACGGGVAAAVQRLQARRLAVAAQRMRELGLEPSAHMRGGLPGWEEFAGSLESDPQKR